MPAAVGRPRAAAPAPRAATLVFCGLALIRLRHHWARSLSMLLGLVLAVALAVSISLVQTVVADLGVERTVQESGRDARVMITQNDIASAATFAEAVTETRTRVNGTAGGLLEPGASYLATTPLTPDTVNGKLAGAGLSQSGPKLAAYADLGPHVTAVSGRLPSGSAEAGASDVEAVVTEREAGRFGLHAGDRYCLVDDQGAGFCARLVGVVRPRPESAAWWGPEQTPDAAVLVDQAAYFRVLQTFRQARSFAHVTFAPDAAAFGRIPLQAALDRLGQLRAHYGVVESDGQISTALDTRLATYQLHVQVAQFALALVVAEVLLLALLYLAFVARNVLDEQREELAVWRSRGWRRSSVWALLTVECGLLAGVAVPVGVAAGALGAAVVIDLVYGTVPVQLGLAAATSLWQPALVAAGLGLCVLAWRAAGASRHQLVETRRMASRPRLRPWWQWRHLDLGLGLLGLVLLARTPVLAEGQSGLDAGTLALPGVGLVLVALAALRLLPLAAGLAGRFQRSVALALASWQLGRRPLQHSLLGLLLLVTVALGVFASTYVSTEQRNAADRAAYAAGADLRARFGGDVNRPPVEQTRSGLRGVTAATSVYRGSGQPGNLATSQPTVLGVDPPSFDRTAWSRPGLNDPSLSSQLDRLAAPAASGQRLPGRPARLGVWAYSSGLDATLVAAVVDARGRSAELTLGRLDFTGWRHLDAAVAAAGGQLAPPLYARELALRGEPQARRVAGTVGLRDLAVGLPGVTQPQVVASFAGPGGTGWWASSAETGLSLGQLQAGDAVPFQGGPATVLQANLAPGELTIRPVPVGPIPALASPGTLRRSLLPTNVPFSLRIGAAQVPIVVVGQVDQVPTLYPGQEDFLIVGLAGLVDRLGYGGEPHAWPNELWANVSPEADGADRASLQRTPNVSEVVDRRDLQWAAARDPLAVQLQANLLMGFAMALVLAVAAFGLHFLTSVTGRRSEYAILEANGLAPRTVRRSLAAEQGILLAFGLLVGLGLGLLVAAIVLPTLHLGTGPTSTFPPTVVTVRWPLVAGALAAVAVLAAAAGAAVSAAGRRFRLMSELRAQ